MKLKIGILIILVFISFQNNNAFSKGSSSGGGSSKSSSSGSSSVDVKGYYRKDGTYVQPYTRSCPNGKCSGDSSSSGNAAGAYSDDSSLQQGSQGGIGDVTLKLDWIKCAGNIWCPFDRVDLSNVKTVGVYIIWQGGQNPRVVKIGQGDIASKLISHRSDSKTLSYNQYGLFVTWANVQQSKLNGIEKYLAEQFKPLIESNVPNVNSIPVKYPFY